MHSSEAKSKAQAAFLRRFPGTEGDIQFVEPQPGYLRVKDARTGAWVDYETSGWRIRAIAWNSPSQQTDDKEPKK
jgi:hypothetical protein